jgi:geranylgeranyl reductase family protein
MKIRKRKFSQFEDWFGLRKKNQLTWRKELDADVIIAGGGPAGSLLGYHLARSGISTIILEKENFPRYKTCGGGISLKAVKNIPFDISPVIEKIPAGGVLNFKGKRCFKLDLASDFAWLAMRAPFDAYLVDQAVQVGAHFCDGESILSLNETQDEVYVKTSRREISGRFLVGADGVNSRVARICGLLPERQTGTALEAELSLPPSDLLAFGDHAQFDFGVYPHGYGWFFPKRDHISAGIFCARPGKTPDLRQALTRHIQNSALLSNATISHQQGHLIPLGGRQQRLHTRRVLLVGDAANLADPWLGEGIYYAVTSACIAARAIQNGLENDSPDLSGYTRQVNKEIVADLAMARTFAAIVYLLPHVCSDLITSSPVMQQTIFGSIRGDFNFQRLCRHLVLKSPLIFSQALFKGIRKDEQQP